MDSVYANGASLACNAVNAKTVSIISLAVDVGHAAVNGWEVNQTTVIGSVGNVTALREPLVICAIPAPPEPS